MGIHLQQCSHDNEPIGTHGAIWDVFASITKVGFHVV